MNPATRMAVIAFLASSALATAAFADDKANSVDGAWNQVEQKNGESQEYVKPQDGTVMTECIVGGRFVWIVVENGSGASRSRRLAANVPERCVAGRILHRIQLCGDTGVRSRLTVGLGGRSFKMPRIRESSREWPGGA